MKANDEVGIVEHPLVYRTNYTLHLFIIASTQGKNS